MCSSDLRLVALLSVDEDGDGGEDNVVRTRIAAWDSEHESEYEAEGEGE